MKRPKPKKDTRDKECPKCKKITNRIYCKKCNEFTIKGQRLVDFLIKETNKPICRHDNVIPVTRGFLCMECRNRVKPTNGWVVK